MVWMGKVEGGKGIGVECGETNWLAPAYLGADR